MKAHIAALGDLDRRRGQRLHPDPPLLADQRLEHPAAAVAVADVMDILVLGDDGTLAAERLGDGEASLFDTHPVEIGQVGRVHGPVGSDDADDRE